MRFPFFRNRDSVKNGILISIRRTGDGFHPGLFNYALKQVLKQSEERKKWDKKFDSVNRAKEEFIKLKIAK